MRSSKDGCTFPPNMFTRTPKITPKPNFGGPFNAKPIIERAVRKSHVNGATKLKLYSYIGIAKCLGVSKFFSLGASGGINLGHPHHIIVSTAFGNSHLRGFDMVTGQMLGFQSTYIHIFHFYALNTGKSWVFKCIEIL